jgi:hypothetical protein
VSGRGVSPVPFFEVELWITSLAPQPHTTNHAPHTTPHHHHTTPHHTITQPHTLVPCRDAGLVMRPGVLAWSFLRRASDPMVGCCTRHQSSPALPCPAPYPPCNPLVVRKCPLPCGQPVPLRPLPLLLLHASVLSIREGSRRHTSNVLHADGGAWTRRAPPPHPLACAPSALLLPW